MSTRPNLPLGDVIYASVKPIFKIYLIIACGFFLGKRNILTVDTARNLSDIILTLAFPCLLFNKMVANLQSSDIKQIGIIAVVSSLLTTCGALSGYLSYLANKPPYWRGSAISVGILGNFSDLPIAYLQTFAFGGSIFTDEEGEKGISYICVFTMFQVFTQFNLGLNKLIGWDFSSQMKAIESVELETRVQSPAPKINIIDTDNSNNNTVNTINNTPSSEVTASLHRDDAEESIMSDDTEESEYSPHLDFNVHPLTNSVSNLSRRTSRVSTLSIRRQRSQNMNDLINEYSEADAIRRQDSHVRPGAFTDLNVVTDEEIEIKSKKLQLLAFFIDNMTRPVSISLLSAIVIAMIPWVKAIFVHSNQKFVHIPDAPDKQPPLSFLMDFTGYVGAASVPLGLLILGSTLSRLQIRSMPKGFWITPFLLSFYKLIISPIIGICFTLGLSKANFFKDDDMLRFICTIMWCLPNATTIIYITAFYSPIDDTEFHQMDYLSLTYMMQYPILAIALPFVTTFTMKVLI